MPKYRVVAHTEAQYITTIEADSEEQVRAKVVALIREGAIAPLVTGFTKIDVTDKDSGSL